ncbi:MAG: phosphoribosyltransferase [Alphaproteobacteria bacterium MedPE-SWcel]|nr:MAG: phosphoribosyltransferase [Alphaproteobacteria bacterium MedPE-SWcel]
MRLDVWQDLHDDLRPGVQADGETFAAAMGGKQLLLPIRTLPDGLRGVASLVLNQASFSVLDAIADHVAAQLHPHAPDIIVAMPTLGLPLGEALARRLGHRRMVPLSTSRKFWYDDGLSTPISSITSPDQVKQLYVDPRMVPLLQDARVAVVDDVLSSGKSMGAALSLMTKIGIAPHVIGCAMLQGETWRDVVGRTPVCHAIHTPILTKTKNGWTQ